MKRSVNMLLAALLSAMMLPAKAQLSEYDQNKPLGWATVDGTVTGSNDENPVTVTTLPELRNALSGTAKKTIYVKGEIEFTGQVEFRGVQNKTVYGLPGSVLVNPTHSATKSQSGIMYMRDCNNIILRNLTFKGAGAYPPTITRLKATTQPSCRA